MIEEKNILLKIIPAIASVHRKNRFPQQLFMNCDGFFTFSDIGELTTKTFD